MIIDSQVQKAASSVSLNVR